MTRAWLLPVGAALAAPLVTWLPMLAHQFPSLGLPPYPPAFGIDAWQQQVFWFCAIGALAVVVGQHDRWLALAMVMAALPVLYRGVVGRRGEFLDPTHALIFALGCFLVALVRYVPARFHDRILALLMAWGVFQAVYALQQAWGNYDVLWGPMLGGTLVARSQPLGTLGTVDALGSYVALAAPLMPWYLLPVAFAAVFVSKSIGAMAALMIGLVIRYRRDLRVGLPLAIGGIAAVAYAFINKPLDTVWARVIMQDFGLRHAMTTNPVLGLGLAGWKREVPAQQIAQRFAPSGEFFAEAHNEVIQWIAELGLVGLVLLALWLWDHRAMFAHPRLAGSLAALAVSCQTFFPLHNISTALFAITLVGLASAHADEAPAGG